MPTTKDEVTAKLVEVIQLPFEEKGFTLQRKCFFEREDVYGNLLQYEINLSRLKGYNSLHLRLHILNKPLLKKVNVILEKALRDESYVFPDNWSEKDIEYSIKLRTSSYHICGLTDWRVLKDDDEPLEDFNKRFAIWMRSFDDIDVEFKDWKEQMRLSVELAEKWFVAPNINRISELAERKPPDKEFIIANTIYPALYLLKEEKRFDELEKRYSEIFESTTRYLREVESKNAKNKITMVVSTNAAEELELFYKYLMM